MGGQRAQLGSFADQLRGGLLDVVTLRSLDAVPGTAGTTQDGQQRRAQYRVLRNEPPVPHRDRSDIVGDRLCHCGPMLTTSPGHTCCTTMITVRAA